MIVSLSTMTTRNRVVSSIKKTIFHTTFRHIYAPDIGGAIQVNGSLKLYSVEFVNTHSEGRGGAVYNSGDGEFDANIVCFMNCSTSLIIDDHGGNAIAVYDHSASLAMAATVYTSWKEIRQFSGTNRPGDSSLCFSTMANLDISDINSTQSMGKLGGIIGIFTKTEIVSFKRGTYTDNRDYMFFQYQSTGNTATMEKIICIRNVCDVHYFMVATIVVTLKDCIFLECVRTGTTDNNPQLSAINCYSDNQIHASFTGSAVAVAPMVGIEWCETKTKDAHLNMAQLVIMFML